MRNKLFITLLIIISIGLVTWGVAHAIEIFWGDTDINPAIPLPPDTIITIPEPYEPKATEPLIVESRLREEKEALQHQKATEKYQSLLRFGVNDTTEWKLYRNSELGISFQYPNVFNRVNMQIVNGDTGRIFTGVLEFVQNHWISFGGATKDYTAARGGSIADTRGYEKQGDEYVIKSTSGEVKIIPNEFWPVNNGSEQAVVVRNMEIGQVLSRDGVAVFVNIPNSPFSGIVFEIHPLYPNKTIDEKEIDILRQIVSSITFDR